MRSYTRATKFSVVAHSLGVTLARKVLQDHPELRRELVAFVGIAGGNHGTSFCPPGSEDQLVSCDEIAAGTPWLEQVGDPAYAGQSYAKSPRLRGAENREFPLPYHNDLRIGSDIVRQYRIFLEQADVLARILPRTG